MSVSRKGITPVIAVLLLIMMTVAAAGGAYVWMNQLQSEITERSTEQLRDQEADITMIGLQCFNEGGSYHVEALLKNSGNTELDLDPVDMDLRDTDTQDLNLTLSRATLSLRSGALSPGVQLNPEIGGDNDFSQPGTRSNVRINPDPSGPSPRFEVGKRYRVMFTFTQEDGRQVSGGCRAEQR